MMAWSPSLVGKRFGNLTVLEECRDKHDVRAWKCVCDCGGVTIARTSALKSSRTKSCGCMRGSKKCLPGCDCRRHQSQPELADRAQWKGTTAGHRSRHRRVYRRRGKAAQHPCVHCLEKGITKQALDWAQIHGTVGTDPWNDFMPLCRRCHLRYDRDSRQAPEAMARWRASVSPSLSAAWTPERRAAWSRRMTEYWAARRAVAS